MHGSYSTERWARQYVYHHVDKFGNPVGDSWYRYFGQDQAWKTDEDYAAWKRTYKAVVFKGATEDHEIVFYYREKLHVISKEEYQALQLPVDTRRMNGDIVIVKVAYDDEDHIVNTYSYAGEIRPGIISGQTHKDLLWNGESIEDMNRDYVGKIGGVNRDDQ